MTLVYECYSPEELWLDEVFVNVLHSVEYRTLLIQGFYNTFLHRTATPTELATFLAMLAGGATDEDVMAAILGSEEYYATRGGGTNSGFITALRICSAVHRPPTSRRSGTPRSARRNAPAGRDAGAEEHRVPHVPAQGVVPGVPRPPAHRTAAGTARSPGSTPSDRAAPGLQGAHDHGIHGRAAAAGQKSRPPPLGDVKGKFRTRGKYASATVTGRAWETFDYCDGTLVFVQSGRVDVLDIPRNTHHFVTGGHSFFAPAP